jgi:hypothetical protein
MSHALSCRAFRRHFSDWRDGVATVDAAAMREHQDGCGRCHALARALDVGVRMLRASELAWPPSRSTPFTGR